MDERFRKLQAELDDGWAQMLAAGRENLGNLEVNKAFLGQVDILQSGWRVLEIGCGTGAMASVIAEKGCDVIGTDISRCAIEYGREKYADVKLEVQAAQGLGYDDGSFDAVVSFDVLEHLPDVDGHIAEVKRLLADGGYYLLQTPNKYSNSIYETLKHKSFKWRRYHPSLQSAGQLRRRFAKHGFDVQFVKMNTINEFSAEKLKRFGGLFSWVRHIDFRRLPLFLQTNFYVVARKR